MNAGASTQPHERAPGLIAVSGCPGHDLSGHLHQSDLSPWQSLRMMFLGDWVQV